MPAPGEAAAEAADAADSAASAEAAEVAGEPEAAAGSQPASEEPARARPRPVRQYAVPAPARTGPWPFGATVYRWQPVVEEQIRTVGRARPLDPSITPELVLAVIAAESLGDPEALSVADAVGLMQLLPSTFADFFSDGDPFDPELNVRAGILYLNLALAREGGDVEWALAAYHAGIGAASRVRAGMGELHDDTLDYVEAVLALRDRAMALRGSAPPVPPLVLAVREKLRPPEAETQVIAAALPASSAAESAEEEAASAAPDTTPQATPAATPTPAPVAPAAPSVAPAATVPPPDAPPDPPTGATAPPAAPTPTLAARRGER